MKCLGLLAVASTSLLLSACGGSRQEPVVSLAPQVVEGAGPTIELVELTPAAGSAVDSTTVIEAKVRYRVTDRYAQAGPFRVQLVFASKSGGGAFRPAPPEESLNGLQIQDMEDRTGVVAIRYPLSLVWSSKLLAMPIRAMFKLMTGAGVTPAPVDLRAGRQLRGPFRVIASVVVEYSVEVSSN